MRNRNILILLITTAILSAACTSLKRYGSLESSGVDNTLADINLFGSRLMQPQQNKEGKSLWDLSADAQSQFIKILNARFPANEMFFNSLSNVYLDLEEGMPADDYVRKDLRLIFSVSRKREYNKADTPPGPSLSPADRLEYIKISLVVKDPSLSFTEWKLYSTEYGSIDIGDVSFSRSLDISASASGAGKKSGPDLSAEAKSSLSRKEDQSVKYRYLRLNGKMNDRGIEMEEEGTRETDLTGNIMAEVSLEFESTGELVTRIGGLRDSSGAFNRPDKLSADSYEVAVPDIRKIKEVIEADLKMDYIYRNVKKGRKTFPEWDDRVKYYEGSVTKPVILFKNIDYVPGFCGIGIGQGDDKEFIIMKRPDGESHQLIFRTYNEAADFHEWLVWFLGKNGVRPLKIGGHLLQFRGKDLTGDNINKEVTFTVKPWYW